MSGGERMTGKPGTWYESMPRSAQERAAHRAEVEDRLQAAQRAECARVDAERHAAYRAPAERTVHIARARAAVGQLARRLGDGAPASWLALLDELRAALMAIAETDAPTAPAKPHVCIVTPLRRNVGPLVKPAKPEGGAP